MKNLKLLIIILIIFAIGLTCTICVLYIENSKSKKNNNITLINTENNIEYTSNDNDDYIMEENPTLSFDTSIKNVQDKSTMYSLNIAINKYFNYIKDNNIQAINELGGNLSYLITNNVKYNLKKAVHTENRYQDKYYTYGILTVANDNYTSTEQEVYIILYIDISRNTYKIETSTIEQMSDLRILTQEENIDIPKGLYNSFEFETVDDVKQMEIYLEDYIFQVFNNTEKSYQLLNEEYRNKRFGDINKYIAFLNEKINQMQNIKITQYNVYEEDEYKIYVGTDENGNYYYIKEKAYMDYELMLDNYTMDDYSDEDDEERIKRSAERFILMINSADYTNAYNLLDENFKMTYFPTEQDFVNYIKSNWFARNIIASKELTENGICIVKIRETISTISNTIERQFKVTLGDGMNFTIEFNI